ncbi:putative nucleobase transporter [Trypanosoma grayi]|uniref:putative nucleobase transporter n=1 Tax=Trypanosoma grayi TaxID=71804 RepID=UPI0004F475DA|nr:putative nucleobase transporter [Trypanosoma grayi]KEG10739.1 putative nucleobase transporter [Trypanosoma grayi]
MALFGFGSVEEVLTYLTAIMCGISMLLPVNAVFSAPLYIMHYYEYVMQDSTATPEYTNFWDNSMTYYILVCLVVSLVVEPLTLTPKFRQIPLQVRMLSALGFLWVEIILLMVVPAVGSTEIGAITTLVVAGAISGSGKSIFESTAYGLFSAFPSRYMAALMGGAGVAGALTSLLQITVKGALDEDYEGTRTQSKIFYGLMVGIQGVTFIMLVLLNWNSYACQFTGSLSGKKDDTRESDDAVDVDDTRDAENPHTGATEPNAEEVTEGERDQSQVVVTPPASEVAKPSQMLSKTDVFGVFKIVYPMTIACAFNFFITLMLFPTVVVSVDPDDYWYGTIAVFIFNVTDVFGRFAPSFEFMWPPRWAVIASSFGRVIFLPLLLLASYHYIPGHAFGYVMMVLFGLSNGYIGALTLVLGPLTEGITTSGQRFVAGTMLGISILVGGALGTALSIMIQSVRTDQ